MHLTQGHVISGGNTPQPVLLVQRGGAGSQKVWNSALLCRFPPAQHVHQEGFIPTAKNTGSAGKHGRCHTFLNNGFQEWILASKNGT